MSLISQDIVRDQVLYASIGNRFVQSGTGFSGTVPMGGHSTSSDFATFNGSEITILKTGNYFINVDMQINSAINRGTGLNFFQLQAGNSILAEISVIGTSGSTEFFNSFNYKSVWVYNNTVSSGGDFFTPSNTFEGQRGKFSGSFKKNINQGEFIRFNLGSSGTSGKTVGFGGFITVGEIT